MEGDIERAKTLLAWGATTNSQNNKGETPLHLAVHINAQDMFALLVRKGANIRIRDNNGRAPMHYAANNGSKALLQLLAHLPCYRPQVNTRPGDPVLTFYMCLGKLKKQLHLSYAVPKDIKKMLCEYAIANAIFDNLLDCSTIVRYTSWLGKNHMISALTNRHCEYIRSLASVQDNRGSTPLDYALNKKNKDTICLLTGQDKQLIDKVKEQCNVFLTISTIEYNLRQKEKERREASLREQGNRKALRQQDTKRGKYRCAIQ